MRDTKEPTPKNETAPKLSGPIKARELRNGKNIGIGANNVSNSGRGPKRRSQKSRGSEVEHSIVMHGKMTIDRSKNELRLEGRWHMDPPLDIAQEETFH